MTNQSKDQVEGVPAIESKVADTLSAAYDLLKGSDPIIEDTRRSLWRRLWAENTTREWIQRLEAEPSFCSELHHGIPDDLEVLNAMRASLTRARGHFGTYFILGLLNARIERTNAERYKAQPAWEDNNRQQGFCGLESRKYLPTADRINYSGFVCIGIQNSHAEWLCGSPDKPYQTSAIPKNTACRIAVWCQAEPSAGSFSEDLLIETGLDSDMVFFYVQVDCATLPLPYGRKKLFFHRKVKSESLYFDFFTPKRKGSHAVCIQLFQSQSLVKSATMVIHVL